MQTDLLQKLHISKDIKNVLFIGGPTASGKTGLAIRIAKELKSQNIETSIISADSRQIYLDMTIGTAKPVERDTKNINENTYLDPINFNEVDHYLFDIKYPQDRYTLFDFKENAETLIKNLHQQNQKVIIAGGTGLYIDAVINNYSHTQTTHNPKIKENLLNEYKLYLQNHTKEETNSHFWKKLHTLSPTGAKNINQNNYQGVLRAIEVQSVANEDKSSLSSKSEPGFDYQLLVLDPSREKLYEHINSRCREMLSEGLIEETQGLINKYSADLPAMTSIGYREFTEYLSGSITQEEALQKFQKATRNYAKRQVTWFRRYKDNPNVQFIDSYKILQK